MKQSTFSLLFSAIFLYALVLNSCKKEHAPNTASNEIAAKIQTWLNIQKSSSRQDINQKIDSLATCLNFSALYYEELNLGEKFIVVPVSNAFKTAYTKQSSIITSLVLILDSLGNIRKGNIVLFMPESEQSSGRLPKNCFYQIFNHQKVTNNDQFTFLGITGSYKNAIRYKNGRLYSFSQMKAKTPEAGNTGKVAVSVCTDWYLVTTYYYEDGSTSTTEEYVGTTCGDSLPPDDGGGSGSTSSTEYIQAVSKIEPWVVAQSKYGYWYVKSFEKLEGIKDTTRTRGHFTSITHQSSTVFNNERSDSPVWATWQQLAVNTSLGTDNASATAAVYGKIIYPDNSNLEISSAEVWAFFIEFP